MAKSQQRKKAASSAKSKKPARPGRRKFAVSFAELVQKVQDGSITSEELEKYFTADAVGDKPFSPKVLVNERVVDIAGIEQMARTAANALALDAARAIRNQAETAVEGITFGRRFTGKQILAEGDSWFNLPDFLFPKTLADLLGRSHRVNNIAKWGDELKDMIAKGEYLRPIEQGNISAFIFSGGGNDMIGGGKLYRVLRIRRSTDHDPDNARSYVKPQFYTALDRVERQYQKLSRQVERRDPNIKIFVHGYDYCVPRVSGHWLGKALERQGFHPYYEKKLARAIVKVLVDAHNDRLASLEAQLPNVVYVNLRGNVSERQWYDELHPRTTGARKLAKAFDKVLRDNGIVVPTG